MNHFKLPIALAVVLATLTACGGGGGNAVNAGGDSLSPDFTTKYVGTWKSGCYTTGIVKDASTNGNANVTDAVTLTRVDGANMTAAYVKTVYASTDTTCSEASIGAIERTGLSDGAFTSGVAGIKSSNGPNKIKIDGQAKLDAITVDQITLDYPALTNSLPSNATTTAGRIKINLADYQAASEKNIVYQSGDKLTLGLANENTYPTALGTTSSFIYTKQ